MHASGHDWKPLLRLNDEDEDEQEHDEEHGGRDGDGDRALASRFLKSRSVLLSGEINKQIAERVIKQLILLEEDGEDPIRVFIDSPGGDADAGYAIFDMLRFITPPVVTIGMGLVASAAAIVLLAASTERRVALPNSHYLIHQPLSGIRGVATEIEIHARELEKLRLKINQMIASETGQSIEKVEQDTDRDYWLSAEEAQEYGLVSRVIASRTEL